MGTTDINNILTRPVAECTAAQVADALTKSFEGYLAGPVNVTARAYESRFRAEDLDPFASHVYLQDDEPAAVLLVSRRGWTSRIAAMGVTPEMRRRGLGRRAMQEAIREATERGDRSITLEVFGQNATALDLYTGLGFRSRRKLYGYRCEGGEAQSRTPDTLSEIDPLHLARVVAREGEPDLPWMLESETLSSATAPVRAYHLDHHAYALISDPNAETLTLRALVVPREDRRKRWGTRLMNALEARFPGRAWTVPAVVPEGLADSFFARLGWKREPLNQLEMSLGLPPGS